MNLMAISDCFIMAGTTTKPFEGTRLFLSTGALKGNTIDKNSLEEVTYENKPSRANLDVAIGDIIFAKMMSTIKVLEITEETKDLIVSTGFFVIHPKEGFNREFILQYLNSRDFNTQKDKHCSGATQKAINNVGLKKIVVPKFDYEIQAKIGKALTLTRKAIDIRNEQIFVLDKMCVDTFVDMFGDPRVNPKNWNVFKLSEVSKLERGRFSPRPRNDPRYFGGSHPYIQTGDINSSEYRLSEYTQTLNDLGTTVSKQFQPGTIVIAIVGATIGATAILQIPVYAPDSVIGITADERHCNNVYLEMLLRFWRQWLLDFAPAAARANINLSILSDLDVIVPPTTLQEEFCAKMEMIETKKALLKQSLDELDSTYNSIVQKAFAGELF